MVPHVHLTGRVFRTCGSTHAFENEGKNPLFGTIHAQNDKLRQVDFQGNLYDAYVGNNTTASSDVQLHCFRSNHVDVTSCIFEALS